MKNNYVINSALSRMATSLLQHCPGQGSSLTECFYFIFKFWMFFTIHLIIESKSVSGLTWILPKIQIRNTNLL